jgi:hypothetical protein
MTARDVLARFERLMAWLDRQDWTLIATLAAIGAGFSFTLWMIFNLQEAR